MVKLSRETITQLKELKGLQEYLVTIFRIKINTIKIQIIIV
jgi:hypothetical protein